MSALGALRGERRRTSEGVSAVMGKKAGAWMEALDRVVMDEGVEAAEGCEVGVAPSEGGCVAPARASMRSIAPTLPVVGMTCKAKGKVQR